MIYSQLKKIISVSKIDTGYLNSLQQLDFVLGLFSSLTGSIGGFTQNTIISIINKEKERISAENLSRVFDKLVLDKYILLTENGTYKATWDGKHFMATGGYEGCENQKNVENTRLDKIENAQTKFRRTQNILALFVVLGTLAAAWYYVIYIGQYYKWWK